MFPSDRQDLSLYEFDSQTSDSCYTLRWSSVAQSHVGRVRMKNEDAFFENKEEGLWLVADGMGGHTRGDRASQAIVSAVSAFKRVEDINENLKQIDVLLHQAHECCREMFPKKVVGSTVAAIFTQYDQCFFIWAGDSRIYRLRDGQFELLTEDHTVAQEKLNRGELSAEEAENHASAHVLTRALGVHTNLALEISHQYAKSGDRYLICSDGLYCGVLEQKIASTLAESSTDEICKKLINLAFDKGGRDNITTIVIDVEKA